MSRSKSTIGFAILLALVGTPPAFAWKMGGPEHLRMMEKIRADKGDRGSPSWECTQVKQDESFTAHAPDCSRNQSIPHAR